MKLILKLVKILKMVSAGTKSDIKKEEIRELFAVSYNTLEVTSKNLK